MGVQVLSQLPPKRQRVIECELTAHQKAHYLRIQEQASAYKGTLPCSYAAASMLSGYAVWALLSGHCCLGMLFRLGLLLCPLSLTRPCPAAEMEVLLAKATAAAAADAHSDLKTTSEQPTRDPVNNVLMQLRKMANHPLLHRWYVLLYGLPVVYLFVCLFVCLFACVPACFQAFWNICGTVHQPGSNC